MIAYQVKVTDLLHLLLSDQEAFFVHGYKSLRRLKRGSDYSACPIGSDTTKRVRFSLESQ